MEKKIKHWATQQYKDLFKRTGRFNNPVARAKFQKIEAKPQTGRRTWIAIQERVATELEMLVKEGHVDRLQTYNQKPIRKTKGDKGKKGRHLEAGLRLKTTEQGSMQE